MLSSNSFTKELRADETPKKVYFRWINQPKDAYQLVSVSKIPVMTLKVNSTCSNRLLGKIPNRATQVCVYVQPVTRLVIIWPLHQQWHCVPLWSTVLLTFTYIKLQNNQTNWNLSSWFTNWLWRWQIGETYLHT